MRSVSIFLKGRGPGKEAALKEFQGSDIEVKAVQDITPVPHNGCRKKKKYLFFK
jgi:small subunit ribosomal protein S11